jgi:hypothetical protein
MKGTAASAGATSEEETDDYELELVRGAISVVASGGARRVTLVGMERVDRLLTGAQALAHGCGVTLRPVRREAGVGWDVAVEPLDASQR